VILRADADGEEPAVPGDAPRCPRCGEVHVLEVVEEVVEAGEGKP
jgi:hypothetical protein